VLVGVPVGVPVGLAGGLLVGLPVGLAGDSAEHLAVGSAVGLAGGLTGGLTVGLVWIIGILRICFWLPELVWTFFLYLRSRDHQQGSQARWLRSLPPYIDELILLPLPFMKTMIVEAYQENPVAARQTIDYLITSTNQQKTAAQAIAEIARGALSQCQTTSEIMAVADQLTWIPSPPPQAVGLFLPQFLEISQSVRATLETRSLSHRYRLIERPISALHRLLNSLAMEATTRQATTFGSIASRWLTILETAQHDLAEQASRSSEIPQEYIAGPALEPESADKRFKGRLDLFHEIETLVLSDQAPILLLYGGRRTGKTSALKYLPRHIGPELVPLLIDIQGAATATTLKGLVTWLARQVVEAAHQSRNLHLPPLDTQALDSDPFPALLEWMEGIEYLAQEKRFLLCLDEFERLSEVVESTQSHAPLNFLRHIMQHRRQWIPLFSGSHTLSELAPYWSDCLINTRTLRVSYLEPQDARDLIVQPIEGFPNIYDEEAVATIVQLTRCQPYLVQLMCYVLVEHLNREHRQRATRQDVDSIVPRVFAEGEMFFREFWHQTLLPEERTLLLELVKGELPHASDQMIVRKLIQKEVLEQAEEGYRFQVPLIQKFVQCEATESL
jgi:AAA+ ATPase superfamily predicted ATPase